MEPTSSGQKRRRQLRRNNLQKLRESGADVPVGTATSARSTKVFASERLTDALLDRLTHHVHILEMNGESFRLKQSKNKT